MTSRKGLTWNNARSHQRIRGAHRAGPKTVASPRNGPIGTRKPHPSEPSEARHGGVGSGWSTEAVSEALIQREIA